MCNLMYLCQVSHWPDEGLRNLAVLCRARRRVVLVTEEQYEQPLKGFTKGRLVIADDVADEISRGAANMLESALLPRWGC